PGPAALAAATYRLAALQPYAPYGLPGRLTTAALGGGEFRPATVLLANFCAFNRLLDLLELPALIESDPTIVGHVLNTYYTRIQAVIQRYGGAVSRIDLAPYGDRFLALFGAPTAHEDDPARAVQTALTIRAELSETNQAITTLLREWAAAHPDQQRLVYLMSITLRQRVGIAGGSVFAGIVGAPERHEYAVIGQPVHLAARLLLGADDNETLLSEDIYRAVSHLVAAQERPPVTIEGGVRPSPVFRAIQPRFEIAQSARRLSRGAPLIGRTGELGQALETAQQALRPGEGGRVLALVGQPGIGKTRLADEMLRALRARVPAATLVHEACQSYDEAAPYATLARLVRRLLYVPATGERAAQARAVCEQVEELLPGWSRFVPLLGALLGLPIAETDVTRALTSEQRRERLHELVAMLCLALARRQPLVLVVDDLQWADASSRAALLRVAEEIPGRPILLLVIYRPDTGLAETWEHLPHAVSILLGDMRRADSAALLAALLNGQLPDELRPLVERAYGTPLFIEEMLRYLLDSGVLVRDNTGEWFCARPVERTAVPAQIEQLLVSRLDQLDGASRAALEVAAVAGRRFSERLLAAVIHEEYEGHEAYGYRNGAASAPAGEDDSDLRALRVLRGASLRVALEELVRAEILTPDVAAIEPAYAFRHALIRDVAYGSILFARRHALHARVAQAIERVYADALDEHRVALAQHYLHAGRSDLAFPHLIQAAEHAQARYANSEALSLYRQALAIAPQPDQAAELLEPRTAALYENLGDLLTLTGDYAAARGNYEWLLRVGVAGDAQARAVRKAALQRKVGGTYERQGSLDQALAWFERAAETIGALAPTPAADVEHARILSDIGWFHFRHGELDQAEQRLEHALALVEPHDAHDELARLLNRLGGIAWNRGDLARAQHYVERSLAASRRSGSLIDQANALNNLGILTESQGRYEEALQYGLQSMALHERAGNRRDMAISAVTVGHVHYNCEEHDRALASFTQALELAAEVRETYVQMIALLDLGRVYAAQRRWPEAESAIQRCQFIAAQLHLDSVQAEAWVVMAEVALGRDDVAAARLAHQQALLLDHAPESEEHGRIQRFAARLALLDGDIARADALLAEAEALFERLQNVPEARRTRQLRESIERPLTGGQYARAV
ncbi:MAG TPA: tetratricopeptide repeat protein, partial [Roseiflexaceae bacterium]|nr:tetratricopeptide repeat protein [Roseiflexaceae bacterium]